MLACQWRRFNFLHLRLENDWLEHCKRWEAIDDGLWRGNCLGDVSKLSSHLVSKATFPHSHSLGSALCLARLLPFQV
jgi:hypothetical protein